MNHILFWSTYSDDAEFSAWKDKIISVSELHDLTLESHKRAGNEVHLFSYQHLNNASFPDNVILEDANSVYPAELAYEALKARHSIAHISDLVRLKAASVMSGVVIDMDAVILREFPTGRGFFSSMPAKMTGAFAPKWGDAHPPLIINDNSWDGKALSAFPVSVDKEMGQPIFNLAKVIELRLQKKPEKSTEGWNFIIWALKKLPLLDKEYKVYKPISFCPVPSWLPKGKCYSIEYPTRLNGKTTLFGYRLPSIKEIMKKSYCVQHFFESAFKDNKKKSNLWQTIPEGCLLSKEAEYILGSDWRNILLGKRQ